MRVKKLQNKLKESDIDLALIFSLDNTPNTNMQYFTGYKGIGVLAVLRKKHFLLVPDMEYEKALQTKLKVYKTEKKKKLLENLSSLLKKEKISSVGIEEDKCTVALYKRLKKAIKGKYKDISELCSKIRMVKEKEEIETIMRACKITDSIFKEICENFNFKTEHELKKFIVNKIQEADCELAFPPIVASGPGSSQPHYDSETKIKRGFLLLDFGAKYKGYCSDMSRTLYVGKPNKEEVEAHNLVLETLMECEKATIEKKMFSDLYDVATETLGEKSEYFTHALGHGVGLDIHEPPALFTEDENKIKDNIVFTIEPGTYYPGKFGIRIEDTVLYKNNKLRILTKSKKDLITV